MGPRYEAIKARIIAFRADVLAHEATFKLGQDERPENFATIVSGLDHKDLAVWMKQARA